LATTIGRMSVAADMRHLASAEPGHQAIYLSAWEQAQLVRTAGAPDILAG